MVSLPCCLMPRGKGRKRVKQTVEYRVARDEDMPRKLLEGRSPARSFRPLQNGIRQQGPSEGERNTAAHGVDHRLASAWQPPEAVWPSSRRGPHLQRYQERSERPAGARVPMDGDLQRRARGSRRRRSGRARGAAPPTCSATRNALSARQGHGYLWMGISSGERVAAAGGGLVELAARPPPAALSGTL